MAKLFVSYSRKDSAAARKLIDALNAIKQDVWVDWEDIPPATDWLEQIFRGIEGSDAFLFLISPDSIASNVCNVEVGHAFKNNKRIIPIVLREVESKSTSDIIRKLNWTHMREQDDFEEALKKIKVAIELDLPWLEEHNRLQGWALDWERRKDPSLLLRGRTLRNARNMIAAATSKDPPPSELQRAYIQHSSRRERNQIGLGIATGIAILALAILTWMAIRASEEAQRQEQLAVTEASAARVAESTARAAESEARFQQGEAENARATAEAQSTVIAEQKQIAEAQRSAARAQIFQSQRELYVSTLLAIDSLLKAPESPSPEAQEILRKNLSLLPQPVAQAAHLSRINSLELSPDGDTFITGSADFTACLWNIEDGKELFCVDSDESVNDVAFGLAGQLLVMGDDSGLVQIVNADDGVVESSFDFDAAVREISVQPGGNLIAAATGNGKIHILTLSEGERREVSTVETSSPLNVSAISPSGQWLAAGSTTGVITVWDLNSLRTPPGSYPRHKGEIRALSFNPRGNFIVTGASDKTAAVSTRSTGELVMAAINEDSVEDVAFSPDSSWFVTVSDDNRIRVWDLESGAERLRMLQEGDVTEVEISPNGRWIATTGSDETVRLWNAATGAELLQIPLEDPGSVLAFSPDSTRLISGDQGGAISIWDISAMTAPESYVTFNGLAANVQFSPSGNLMAASDARRIWLLNPESVSSQRLSTEDAEGISFRSNLKDVIVSPDAKWLGTLTEGGQVTLYGITDSSVRTLRIPSSVSAIAYSPDSLQLMTGDVTGNVQTWAVSNGSLLQELFQEERGVLGMAASQELLAVGFQDNIVIVDINSQEKLPGIQSPGDHSLLAFRADGSLLASMNSSGQVNVWEYQNGKFSAAGSFTRAQALSLALHPQESLIAVGTASEVYLVDFTTGEEIARIPHRDATRDLAFSPDGNILATASSGAIQLWDVARLRQLRIQADALIPTACSRIPLNFSDPEWGELFALCEDSQAQQSTNSP